MWDSVLSELLAEAASFPQSHANDLIEPTTQRINGVEMLLLGILPLEMVPYFCKLLVLLIEMQKLSL